MEDGRLGFYIIAAVIVVLGVAFVVTLSWQPIAVAPSSTSIEPARELATRFQAGMEGRSRQGQEVEPRSIDHGVVLLEDCRALASLSRENALRKAAELCEEAVQIFEKRDTKLLVYSTYRCLSDIYEKLGEGEKLGECATYLITAPLSWGEGRESLMLGGGQSIPKVAEGNASLTTKQPARIPRTDVLQRELNRQVDVLAEEIDQLENLGRSGRRDPNLGLHVDSLCQRVIEYYKTFGIDQQISAVMARLGLACSHVGLRDTASASYEQAIEMFKKLGDFAGEGSVQNNYALTCLNEKYYDKALKAVTRSLALANRADDKLLQAASLLTLGIVRFDLGEHGKAIEAIAEAEKSFNRMSVVEGKAKCLLSMGRVHFDLGVYAKAMELVEEARDMFAALGDKEATASCLVAIGETKIASGENYQGEEMLGQAAEIMIELGYGAGGPLSRRAHLMLDRGDTEKSHNLIMLLTGGQGWQPALLGRLYMAEKEYSAAQSSYRKLLNTAEKNGNFHDIFVASTGLGLAYEALAAYDNAAMFYRKAVESVEEVRSALSPRERRRFFDVKVEGFFRTVPFKGLARVLLHMQKPYEALKVSEYTKARCFAESVGNNEPTQLPAALRDLEESLRELDAEIAALKRTRREERQQQREREDQSLHQRISELEKKRGERIEVIRRSDPLFAATKYPEPMNLAQSKLNQDEWVLSYDVMDSGLIIYLTRGKTVVKAHFKPVPSNDFKAQVQKFMEPLQQARLMDFDPETSRVLADTLLGDVLPALPEGVPLIIVPDDFLAALPFEMLVLDDGGKILRDKSKPYPHMYVSGAKFFGDRNPISYQQSITALTLTRLYGTKKSPGEKLLVIADPLFQCTDERAGHVCGEKGPKRVAKVDEDLYSSVISYMRGGHRLAGTAKLAESLKEMFPGKAEVYTGLDANKTKFFQDIVPRLDDFGRVVFATHGEMRKDVPGIIEPVLMFTLVPPGTDGYLRQSEVMGRLKMNADIVALTACESGMGQKLAGEGVMSMGRAFQYAGARSVLMSLWSVAEVPSIKLTESFFKHLKDGRGKLEALRFARKEIREAGYDHPFFWASFILVGEPN